MSYNFIVAGESDSGFPIGIIIGVVLAIVIVASIVIVVLIIIRYRYVLIIAILVYAELHNCYWSLFLCTRSVNIMPYIFKEYTFTFIDSQIFTKKLLQIMLIIICYCKFTHGQ